MIYSLAQRKFSSSLMRIGPRGIYYCFYSSAIAAAAVVSGNIVCGNRFKDTVLAKLNL